MRAVKNIADVNNLLNENITNELIKGIIITVKATNWVKKNNKYEYTVTLDGLTGEEILTVCLYNNGTATEEQINTYNKKVKSVESKEDKVVLTAEEEITTDFVIAITGNMKITNDGSGTAKVEFSDDVNDYKMDGVANVGTSNKAARADHIHPDNKVFLTQKEYDELPDTKLTDGKDYVITDSDDGVIEVIQKTWEEYEKLPESVKQDDRKWFVITDKGNALVERSAEDTSFNNDGTGLTSENVQDAIEEVNNSLNGLITKSVTVTCSNGIVTYLDSDIKSDSRVFAIRINVNVIASGVVSNITVSDGKAVIYMSESGVNGSIKLFILIDNR